MYKTYSSVYLRFPLLDLPSAVYAIRIASLETFSRPHLHLPHPPRLLLPQRWRSPSCARGGLPSASLTYPSPPRLFFLPYLLLLLLLLRWWSPSCVWGVLTSLSPAPPPPRLLAASGESLPHFHLLPVLPHSLDSKLRLGSPSLGLTFDSCSKFRSCRS